MTIWLMGLETKEARLEATAALSFRLKFQIFYLKQLLRETL